jgi:hypothetical protein
MLSENDEDVETVQSLMRHANSNITHEHLHPRGEQQETAGAD